MKLSLGGAHKSAQELKKASSKGNVLAEDLIIHNPPRGEINILPLKLLTCRVQKCHKEYRYIHEDCCVFLKSVDLKSQRPQLAQKAKWEDS